MGRLEHWISSISTMRAGPSATSWSIPGVGCPAGLCWSRPLPSARRSGNQSDSTVALTKKQIEDSPPIDTHKPVSRQHEALYMGYYGYPYYWGGPYLWGRASYPAGLTVRRESVTQAEALQARAGKESADSHLRSTNEVKGYHIEAADAEIGHVEDFIIDDETWAIRYLEVDTRNWWPGKKVLVSPQWIEQVSWPVSKVFVHLSRETIKNGPEYFESMPITREYENRLYSYYGRPAYWLQQSEQPSSRKASKG